MCRITQEDTSICTPCNVCDLHPDTKVAKQGILSITRVFLVVLYHHIFRIRITFITNGNICFTPVESPWINANYLNDAPTETPSTSWNRHQKHTDRVTSNSAWRPTLVHGFTCHPHSSWHGNTLTKIPTQLSMQSSQTCSLISQLCIHDPTWAVLLSSVLVNEPSGQQQQPNPSPAWFLKYTVKLFTGISPGSKTATKYTLVWCFISAYSALMQLPKYLEIFV